MSRFFETINIERHGTAIIFFLGVALLLPCIWCETSITGQDEYWLSFRTPMETMERGAWLTTWVNEEPRLKKPPLLYWAILTGYKFFGINLFAARIWAVLAGAGLAVCSCLLYKRLFEKSGLLAGLMTLATVAVAIEGRRAMLDLPLAFFTCMSVYFALNWIGSGYLRWILLAGLSLGLSFMTKGPLGFVFFGAAAISAILVFGKWRFAFSHRSQAAWAFVLLLAICLPWPILMAFKWPEYISIIHGEMAERSLGTVHFGSPVSALGKALVLVLPWSPVLVAALIHSVYHARQGKGRENLWLAVWFLASTLPCFIMQCFSRYMMPIIPAACVLCAYWIEETDGKWKTRLIGISIGLIVFAGIFFCLFFIWFGLDSLMALLCLLIAGLVIWTTFVRKDNRMAVLTVAIFIAFLIGGLYPSLGINAMPVDLDRIVGFHQVASFDSSQPSMLSMRLKRSVIRIRSFDKKDIRLLEHFDGFVFMRETDARGFEKLAGQLDIHYVMAGQFKTFWSRQAWLRFARKDADYDDWKEAIRTRSLANLKSGICYYRVRPQPD